MKLENTLVNKAKFFALYWGQDVACHKNHDEGYFLGIVNSYQIDEIDFLELTPLSQISDEDAIEVIGLSEFKARQNNPNSGYFGMSASGIFVDTLQGFSYSYLIDEYSMDYLRSKGYAIDWLGLSVEDLIEYGWVKLKD